MYIKFENGLVSEIIPDIDPTFHDVPIGERYPAEFVSELKYFADDTEVEYGMEYNEETGGFEYPTVIPAADYDGYVNDEAEDTGDITQAEINLEVDYRLSCIELGINL